MTILLMDGLLRPWMTGALKIHSCHLPQLLCRINLHFLPLMVEDQTQYTGLPRNFIGKIQRYFKDLFVIFKDVQTGSNSCENAAQWCQFENQHAMYCTERRIQGFQGSFSKFKDFLRILQISHYNSRISRIGMKFKDFKDLCKGMATLVQCYY